RDGAAGGLHRSGPAARRALARAELAAAARAPGERPPVPQDRRAVRLTREHVRGAAQPPALPAAVAGGDDRDGGGAELHRAVAELTGGVVAPGDDGAVRAQRVVVLLRRGDRGDPAEVALAAHPRHEAGGEAVPAGAVAELPQVVVAPRRDPPVPQQRQPVLPGDR